ncbi:TniQ family protein [Rhizobium leguminosarum]|uniref:TniQ family protein n=1 Tax=Rhizobium leguminosarum TaxID=384 RepID=UPI0003FDD75A|nr:TniQ family protein [Rhizobium leguminosarum]
MTLPVLIEMHEEETPVSRANRLSSANGFSSFSRFLEMTSISLSGLSTGNEECIAKLAWWSGADHVTLARYASRTESRKGTWRIGDATFGKESRPGSRFRYCPQCVVEDLETAEGRPVSRPYVRPSWMCRAVLNCTDHRRPILEFPFASRRTSDFCQFVASNLDCIRAQAFEPGGDISMEIDEYIRSRIRGASAEPYLDRFEAFVAVELCDHLGRFLKSDAVTSTFVPDELRGASAREIGFHFARKGETEIRSVIGSVICRKQPKGTARFSFGVLGRWLRSNTNREEYLELVELFQDVAERNLPYGPGETCLVPVRRRYLHSVHSAGLEYGLFEERIIELLRTAGLIGKPSKAHSSTYFDAAQAHPILLAATQTLTSQEARRELGVSQGVIVQLLQSGLLPRVEERTSVRGYSRIRVQDLREFQHRIFETVVVGEMSDDMLTIAKVCRATLRETADVLSALIDGSLEKVSAPPNHGNRIDRLLFDRDEVVQYFVRPRQIFGEVDGSKVLKQRDAATYLKVKTATVPYLMTQGLLESRVAMNPVIRRKQSVISVAALDAFMEEFMAVSEVAAQYETHTNVVLEALRKAGVVPIYDDCGAAVSRFIRRRELADVSLDIPKRRKRNRRRSARPA